MSELADRYNERKPKINYLFTFHPAVWNSYADMAITVEEKLVYRCFAQLSVAVGCIQKGDIPEARGVLLGVITDMIQYFEPLIGVGHTQETRSVFFSEVARVFDFGAKKYARNNWQKGLPYSNLLDSAGRHLLAILAGDSLDKESELHHTHHIAWNLYVLLHQMSNAKGSVLSDTLNDLV